MSREYRLAEDMVILSTSDLKGNIVDYNKAFQEASGYSDAELRGQPHRILRHPDMPKEAFKDFWSTIQSGKPWFGIVKNKRKNGDYYWVAANASPICEQGKITGYLSVRYPASAEQKAQAESLYKGVKAGQASFPWTRSESLLKRFFHYLIASVGIVAAVVFLILQTGLNVTNVAVAMLGFVSVGYLLMRVWLDSKISKTLWQGVEDIANARFRAPIVDNSEWGFALNMIRSRIAEQAARNYDALQQSQVLSTALNAASTNIMVADTSFTIQSMNASLAAMFKRNESALKTVLPQFDASKIVGANMDIFHKNPAHQRAMVERLTQPWTGELELAGLFLRLTVVPIMHNQSKIGYVVEWLDRTAEASISREIICVMDKMQNGKYQHRVTVDAQGELLVIKNSINASMDALENAMKDITRIVVAQSNGDLTHRINTEYHGELRILKEAVNSTADKLDGVVSQAVEASKIVSVAAYEVSEGSTNLSQRVQEQAAALEQTSATMDEMNAAVQNNTDNARHTVSVAKQVRMQVEQGAAVMQKTIAAMNAIQDSSHKIAEIVTLIDGIAFQTNLLALNAAVEAARAGDHGRGFAVVAGEVRALAQKSAEAAKDIRSLIDESVARIDEGTKLASESGNGLQTINGSINEVAEMIDQIAQASHEQAQGIKQVHIAISQIDGVTQQNAALVEETSAASESLSEQARVLLEDMAFFKTKKDYALKQLESFR